MRLRKPCEHGRYDAHGEAYVTRAGGGTYRTYDCPGGEFLANDALIIEKVDGEWPTWAWEVVANEIHEQSADGDTAWKPLAFLDALTVREGA